MGLWGVQGTANGARFRGFLEGGHISAVRLQGEELEKQGWGWHGARGLRLSAVGALHQDPLVVSNQNRSRTAKTLERYLLPPGLGPGIQVTSAWAPCFSILLPPLPRAGFIIRQSLLTWPTAVAPGLHPPRASQSDKPKISTKIPRGLVWVM